MTTGRINQVVRSNTVTGGTRYGGSFSHICKNTKKNGPKSNSLVCVCKINKGMIFANQTTMCFICTCNAQEWESRQQQKGGDAHARSSRSVCPLSCKYFNLCYRPRVNAFEAAEFTRFVHRQKFEFSSTTLRVDKSNLQCTVIYDGSCVQKTSMVLGWGELWRHKNLRWTIVGMKKEIAPYSEQLMYSRETGLQCEERECVCALTRLFVSKTEQFHNKFLYFMCVVYAYSTSNRTTFQKKAAPLKCAPGKMVWRSRLLACSQRPS